MPPRRRIEPELTCEVAPPRLYPCAFATSAHERVAVATGVANTLALMWLGACTWRHDALGVEPPLHEPLRWTLVLAYAPFMTLTRTSVPGIGFVLLSFIANLASLGVAVALAASLPATRRGAMSLVAGDADVHYAVGGAAVAVAAVALLTTLACHSHRDAQ